MTKQERFALAALPEHRPQAKAGHAAQLQNSTQG